MQLDTLKGVFRAIFDPETLDAAAAHVGTFRRDRKVRAADFALALIAGCCTGPTRSIAGTRRAWERLAGDTISPGAFDDHVADVRHVRWLWHLFGVALATSNRRERRGWPPALHALADIQIEDGSRMAVRARLAALRSTTPGGSAIKLMGRLSLGEGQLVDLRTAAAVHHDRPLLRGWIVSGVLYLRDLGFYDHRVFAAIDEVGAYFVSRLKSCVRPTPTRIVVGFRDGDTPGEVDGTGPVCDLDARFHVAGMPGGQVLRVVKYDVPLTDRHGRRTGATQACWYVTNLPRDTWPPESIAAIYRVRWALERLWRSSKHLARLDHLDTARLTVLYVFIAASMLLQVLADRLTTVLEDARGIGTVSRDVMLATLLTWWPELASLLRQREGWESPRWLPFRNVLVYDSRHRNPSQPLQMAAVLAEIELRSQMRKLAA